MTITIQRAQAVAGTSRVTFSPVAIAEFNRTWPGSWLDSDHSYEALFDGHGHLLDSTYDQHLPGIESSEFTALEDDARELLMTGDRPAWARFSEIIEGAST